ncbi:hypothetical protein DFH28DRAFT_1004508 [Melampsora americana]|nr:hypothetical protein DFH28DRAFT_1004508 [Melampsora americana]
MKSLRCPITGSRSTGPSPAQKLEKQLDAWKSLSSSTHNSSARSSCSSAGYSLCSFPSQDRLHQSCATQVAIPTYSPTKHQHDEPLEGTPNSHTYQIIDSTNLNRYRATVMIIDSECLQPQVQYVFVSQSLVTPEAKALGRTEELSHFPRYLSNTTSQAPTNITNEHHHNIATEQAPRLPREEWPVLMSHGIQHHRHTQTDLKPEPPARVTMSSRLRGLTRGRSLTRKQSPSSPTSPRDTKVPDLPDLALMSQITAKHALPSLNTPRKRKEAIIDNAAHSHLLRRANSDSEKTLRERWEEGFQSSK